MGHFILVTGASSGIGESACKALSNLGYEILAGVRNEADALRWNDYPGGHIHPLIIDVTDEHGLIKARQEAESIIGRHSLVAIINNAGIVVSGAVLYIPVEEWRRQFEVNLYGVIRVTQLFFPLLLKKERNEDRHPRRIINMSSVSGLFASPFLSPYVASKFALEGMSDSLRRELYMYDIQVVLIEAGNIVTPMWEKAKSDRIYFGPEYDGIMAFKDKIIDSRIAEGLPVTVIDDIITKVITKKKVKPRYLIVRSRWKFRLLLSLPTAWVDRMTRKKLQARSGIRPF